MTLAVVPAEEKKELVINNSALSTAILGFNPGGIGVQLSQVDTIFLNLRWYLISNMRQPLSEAYVELGLVKTIVDVPVDDGMRGGVIIKSKQISPEQITQLNAVMEREDICGSVVGQTMKWNRLYGGAGTLIITDQDPATPLDVTQISADRPLEFRAVDMWELYWDKQNTEGYNAALQEWDYEYYSYYGTKLHKSRVLKTKGMISPSFIRPRLRGWGISVVELLVRSINQYLKATDLSFEVLDEFKLDIYKIKNLANTLLSSDGIQRIQQRVQTANMQKNYQHAITMDSEDAYEQKELSFSGLAETMTGIRMQVASDMRMPMTKLFGISAAGFSSGEDDIENYNAMVESEVRSKSKYHILRIVEILCQREFGFIPDDLMIEFKPLRVLSSEQEENVKTQRFNRVQTAFSTGQITSEEYRDSCNQDNLLPIKLEANPELLGADTAQEGDEEAEADKIPSRNPVAGPKSTLDVPEGKVAKNALEEFKGPKIVAVGIISGDEILTGKRRDNGLWTSPGGHMDEGEDPAEAACREVMEESGIQIGRQDLKLISCQIIRSPRTGKDFMLYAYTASVNRKTATAKNDPDKEISTWKWVKIDPATPELQPQMRHAQNDAVLCYLFGPLMKNADDWFNEYENELVSNPGKVDEGLWAKAKDASQQALGKIKYAFVTWWYKKQGGKFE